MNWIRENKFLTGFIAILVVCAGAFGYLLYSAYDSYSDVSDQYTGTANDLHQLQARVPYPDEQNLFKYKAERDDLIKATHSLAASLSDMVLPVEELTPSAFQDRLRDTVSAVVTAAGKDGVKLPEHFALDFDKYQTQPPPAAAAGPLGRQLAALQIAMNILLDEHVDSVVALKRTPLTQEGGLRTERGGGGGGRGGGGFGQRGEGGGGESAGENLVERIPFQIQFTGGQPAFKKVLNDFAASSKQFFIVSSLIVENSDPKPIAKSDDTSAPSPTPDQSAAATSGTTATGAPDTSGENGHLKFIVGTEKVNVAMRIDMVVFHTPETSSR